MFVQKTAANQYFIHSPIWNFDSFNFIILGGNIKFVRNLMVGFILNHLYFVKLCHLYVALSNAAHIFFPMVLEILKYYSKTSLAIYYILAQRIILL